MGPAIACGILAWVVYPHLRDLAKDEITLREATIRSTKCASIHAGGFIGGVVGQALIPIPVVGAMVGRVLGGAICVIIAPNAN